MSIRPLKVGIIGCGKQAPKHIDGLRSAGRDVEIVVFDVRQEAVADLVRTKRVLASAGADEVLSDPQVDAVIVATPTPYHHDTIIAALGAGKHIFCEKPLCSSREEAENIKSASDREGRLVQVGYVYRFVPSFLFAQEVLSDPEQPLGKPVTASFRLGGRGSHNAWKHRRDAGGGAINEMLVHMLDLASWLLGPLESARWLETLLLRPEREIGGTTFAADAEDFVLVSAKGREGAHVLLQADLVTPSFQQYIELQGDNGSLMGSIQADNPSYLHLVEPRGSYRAGRFNLPTTTENLFHNQMKNFIRNIDAGATVDCASVNDTINLFTMLERNRAI